MFTKRNGEPRIGLIIFLVIATLIIVPLGAWGFKVATSDIKGQGDAIVNKNDAINRVNKQELFEDLYAEIKAADAKIAPAQTAVDADPTTVNTTNLTGLTNYCIDVVADYNAEARKFSAEDFRAIDLPAQVDGIDAATDCK